MPFQFRKEAIEEDLNTNFPSQGQGNPPLYYSLSEVVVPTYSINSVAEGSGLGENLQTAWDFSTTHLQAENGTQTLANVSGFYRCAVTVSYTNAAGPGNVTLAINDGLGDKIIWRVYEIGSGSTNFLNPQYEAVIWLRSGDSLTLNSSAAGVLADGSARQIADATGNLVNPLGYSAA